MSILLGLLLPLDLVTIHAVYKSISSLTYSHSHKMGLTEKMSNGAVHDLERSEQPQGSQAPIYLLYFNICDLVVYNPGHSPSGWRDGADLEDGVAARFKHLLPDCVLALTLPSGAAVTAVVHRGGGGKLQQE